MMFSANLFSIAVLTVAWSTVWLHCTAQPGTYGATQPGTYDAAQPGTYGAKIYGSSFYVPPFLQGEPQSTIKEYNELIQNLTLQNSSLASKEFDEWIVGKGQALQERYKQYNKLLEQQKKAIALYQAEFDKLSMVAKRAQLEMTRMNTYVNELQRKINEFYSALPIDVKNELDKFHSNHTLEV